MLREVLGEPLGRLLDVSAGEDRDAVAMALLVARLLAAPLLVRPRLFLLVDERSRKGETSGANEKAEDGGLPDHRLFVPLDSQLRSRRRPRARAIVRMTSKKSSVRSNSG